MTWTLNIPRARQAQSSPHRTIEQPTLWDLTVGEERHSMEDDLD